MQSILTTCPYCGCGCGLYLQVRDGNLVGVMPSLGHPVSQGKLCLQGWHAHELVNSPGRLRSPLIRRNGQWQEVSWEQALSSVAERLAAAREVGPHTIGVLGSARCTNEDNFLLMKLARLALRTNNLDCTARLGAVPSLFQLPETVGLTVPTNSITELTGAEAILICRSNLAEQHPLAAYHVMQALKNGATLIVISPRQDQLAKLAHLHLQPRPGSEPLCINGLIQVVIEEGLTNPQFISADKGGYQSLAASVSDFSPESVEQLTGVPSKQVRAAAKLFANARTGMIVSSQGTAPEPGDKQMVLSLVNLALVTGHLGRRAAGVIRLTEQNNLQGACDVGMFPNCFSGYQFVRQAEAQRLEQTWKANLSLDAGWAAWEMLDRVKVMLVMGDDPAANLPHPDQARKALEELDFLVVQDIYMSETAQLADVVLPGASFAEKEGTFTSAERRVQRVRKAIEPVGSARADWEIICDLSHRLGLPMSYGSPAEIMEEMAAVTPIYRGISYPRLEKGWGLQWPCPGQDHPGTETLSSEGFLMQTPRFSVAEGFPPGEATDDEYPLLLWADTSSYPWEGNTMARESATLNREHLIRERDYPAGYLEINPQDAQELGIRPGAPLRVISRRGEMEAQALISAQVAPGTLSLPYHRREKASSLLAAVTDPDTNISRLQPCAVRVEPA